MDHVAARRAMIDNQLRPEAVTDGAVLAAMGSVAREDFVPDSARAFAYVDRPITIRQRARDDAPGRARPPAQRTCPARRRARARGRRGERLQRRLARGDRARRHVERRMATRTGGAFDLVLIDGAVEHVPQSLIDRLVEGGRLGAALRVVGGQPAGRRARRRRAGSACARSSMPTFPRCRSSIAPRAFTF